METQQLSKGEKAKRPTRYHSKNDLAERYRVVVPPPSLGGICRTQMDCEVRLGFVFEALNLTGPLDYLPRSMAGRRPLPRTRFDLAKGRAGMERRARGQARAKRRREERRLNARARHKGPPDAVGAVPGKKT